METPRGQYPKVFGLVAIVCQFIPGLLWICVDGYAATGSSRPFASNFNPDKSRIPPTPCASTRTSRVCSLAIMSSGYGGSKTLSRLFQCTACGPLSRDVAIFSSTTSSQLTHRRR